MEFTCGHTYTRVHLQEFLFLITPQFVPHVKGHIYLISLTCMGTRSCSSAFTHHVLLQPESPLPTSSVNPAPLSSLSLTGTAPRNYPRLGITDALVTEWHLLLDYLPHACQLHLPAWQLNWGCVGSWCPCGFVFIPLPNTEQGPLEFCLNRKTIIFHIKI